MTTEEVLTRFAALGREDQLFLAQRFGILCVPYSLTELARAYDSDINAMRDRERAVLRTMVDER